ncbi:cobaltochelatase subunit CobN [Methanothrix sp.]|uniref:cobaltochelatase subunit CobN n=2 Tax=Methanothrix sp. TaxID=90426 RepID=UPI00257D03F2|nr:cobaltochelatase subunit CobN [Methanothrix sp.]NPU87392.1 cobaltochelatase subunit CobN [Methanothrix sp.]
MRVTCLVGNSYIPIIAKANRRLGLNLRLYSNQRLSESPEMLEEAIHSAFESDLVFIHRGGDALWDELEPKMNEIGKRTPIVCLGYDSSYWMLSTAPPDVVITANTYLTYGGEENICNMFLYLEKELLDVDTHFDPPKPLPWEGLYHPDAADCFDDIDAYLEWYEPDDGPTVGVLISRFYWANGSLAVEDELIRALENQGLNVIPVFTYSVRDKELGTRSMADVVSDYFLDGGRPRIDALVKTIPFFLGQDARSVGDSKSNRTGIDLLKRLNVPVFEPIISYHMTLEEWESSIGLSNDIGWSVAMPEFEGVIEPIIIGAGGRHDEYIERAPIRERCERLAMRVRRWIELARKPVSQRRVAFILHNNPCASVEAAVGGGAHLDTLESVARIMNRMVEAGYSLENVPATGGELIENIMNRKAISEFRWTTIEEIVAKGGVLAYQTKEEYERWFNTLSPTVRDRVCEAWGNPPGEEKNGIPAAMLYQGKIVITGVRYGNVVICVQPKRGCAGARCDGQVCKILHDPDVPPTHQYMATYRYIEESFGADVIIHVGTHGNLEFLPGKGVGLSRDCYPDICIGTIPHLYIYNADNPPEGTIAKRRSYAVLIDHMQTVMTQSGLYDELLEVDRLLGEYESAKHDHARSHELRDLLIEAIKAANLDKGIKLTEDTPLEEIVRRTHNELSRVRNTQIDSGMHIFGQIPEGYKRVEFINAVLRFEGNGISPRRIIASMMGLDLDTLLSDQGAINEHYGKSHGQLLEMIDERCRKLIDMYLHDGKVDDVLGISVAGYERELETIRERVLDLQARMEASREIEALLNGMNGGYVEAGPSGLITRGRDDVLPTGRNFYSLDPYRVPTKTAWRVGKKLGDAVIAKHLEEEGRYPENVAFFWMCSDIMWADGEDMAQILYLLGTEPVWLPNGRLKGFRLIPLDTLGRPRIDVTVRVSGITRDNFPNCIEIIDEAVQAVAALDEPLEMNFVRKHALASLDNGTARDWREATLRIFASKPGTYQSGTNLAVYASAWKDEKDLSDIFVYWNGYAYGKGVSGREAHQSFVNALKSVDITYNKVVSDEYDLFGCCCYFGTHGGMTAAARHLSGKDVKAYYGDTREPEHVEVRDLADEIRRVVRTKLLNPKWIEGMKQHGYKGAGDISKRVGRVYGWEATTQEVDDWIFDEIARTFIMDEENRRFFEEHNPWALEEMGRRLLEAEQRGLWKADPEVLNALKSLYLEIEGWIEDKMGDVGGSFQGGAIDVVTAEEVAAWKEKMAKLIGT